MITVGTIPEVSPIDITNASSCVPMEKVMAMLPNIVLKADAINLALCCFVAGMIVMWAFDKLDNRWK